MFVIDIDMLCPRYVILYADVPLTHAEKRCDIDVTDMPLGP